MPALRERQQLQQYADELADLRATYDAAIQESRLGVGPSAHYDLQASRNFKLSPGPSGTHLSTIHRLRECVNPQP